MKVKISNKLTKAIDTLNPISPISLNEKVIFFLGKGFTPDEMGYLHKNNKYLKIVDNGITITEKSKIWKNGVAIDSNVQLLHIED